MILVTGGAGYIGSHTVLALRGSGFETLVLDDFSTGHRDFVTGPCVEADIGDAAALDDVFRRYPIDGVIHFAGKALVPESVKDPALYYRTNVSGGVNLLGAMRRAGVRAIVFSSSCATYGIPEASPIHEQTPQRPVNPYGETKLAFERALHWFRECHGIEYLALRYFNAAGADPEARRGEDHGEETHLIPRILDVALNRRPHVEVYGTDYPTPDGTCIRDYVHVVDLADAHVRAVQRLLEGRTASQAINLGSGAGHSVREILDAARQVTGVPMTVQELPRREGDPPELVAAVTRARDALQWTVRDSGLDRIMSTAWNWHRHRFGRR